MKHGHRRNDGFFGRFTDAAAAVCMVLPGAIGAAVAFYIFTVLMFAVSR